MKIPAEKARQLSGHDTGLGSRSFIDKAILPTDPTLEWVTPGHPLFEAVRDDVADRVAGDLKRGAVFYDLQAKAPTRMETLPK